MPAALVPNEADVRNTIRIPYPEGYRALLDTYVEKGTSVTAVEDGIALVRSFIRQSELAKGAARHDRRGIREAFASVEVCSSWHFDT